MSRRKILQTTAFAAIGLPQTVQQQIVDTAVAEKARQSRGTGRFFYLPMDINQGETCIKIIACVFTRAGNLTSASGQVVPIQVGDVSLMLRSEWNEDKNPLDDQVGDGQHRRR